MVSKTSNSVTFVITSVQADVSGDGTADTISLIGDRDISNAAFIRNITLVIEDGSTGQTATTSFPDNAGYNPRLFIGDFTGDSVPEIFISIDSGGSGGFGFYYIYSYKNKVLRKLFDREDFNRLFKYRVDFRNGCKVAVYSEYFRKTYIIDVSSRVDFYQEEGVYNRNCRLLKPTEGFVPGLNNLYPLSTDMPNRYNLLALQRVIGLFGADTLGILETTLQLEQGQLRGVTESVN